MYSLIDYAIFLIMVEYEGFKDGMLGNQSRKWASAQDLGDLLALSITRHDPKLRHAVTPEVVREARVKQDGVRKFVAVLNRRIGFLLQGY